MKDILITLLPVWIAIAWFTFVGFYYGYKAGNEAREIVYREEVKTTYLNADYKEVFEACTRELYKQQSQ